MKDNVYTIGLPDIKGYLDSLSEDDKVGDPDSRQACLVANTLKWKYPGVNVLMGLFNKGATVNGLPVEFPGDVFQAAQEFDDLHNVARPITKEILRERLSESLYTPLFNQEV